jgi:glycerophosphoryl diester phosphodiesterase
MTNRSELLALLPLLACASSPANPESTVDASVANIDSALVTADAAVTGDYHSSLSACWSDASCPRVLAVAHGGSWDAQSAPYLSNAALAAAFAAGDEGVRFTKDGVAVLAHSSPIELYESLDCYGKKIEDMTAAQVTGCHRAPSTTEKFQRLDDVLGYIKGKMVAQLCVKRATEFDETIAAIHGLGAEDYAFIEIDAGEFLAQAPTLVNTGAIRFMVNVAGNLGSIADVLAVASPKAFMIEIDPDIDIGNLVDTQLHPAGVRAFVYDNAASPTVAQLKSHYAKGFDVVSSQSGPKGVEARQATNQASGITPP